MKLGDASEVWRGWERLGKVKRIREDGQGWVEGREVRWGWERLGRFGEDGIGRVKLEEFRKFG